MNQQAKQLQQEWEINPRWKNVSRTYSAEDVIRLRGSIQLEYTLAKRGADEVMESIVHSGLDLKVFFYNPNIQPKEEYEIRKNENKRFCDK